MFKRVFLCDICLRNNSFQPVKFSFQKIKFIVILQSILVGKIKTTSKNQQRVLLAILTVLALVHQTKWLEYLGLYVGFLFSYYILK